jgi:hypothetical protein
VCGKLPWCWFPGGGGVNARVRGSDWRGVVFFVWDVGYWVCVCVCVCVCVEANVRPMHLRC